jgi:hypothetical protein
MSAPPPPPPAPPKSFPYDHLFKLLMIGDAGVGKVRCNDTVISNSKYTVRGTNKRSFWLFRKIYKFF